MYICIYMYGHMYNSHSSPNMLMVSVCHPSVSPLPPPLAGQSLKTIGEIDGGVGRGRGCQWGLATHRVQCTTIYPHGQEAPLWMWLFGIRLSLHCPGPYQMTTTVKCAWIFNAALQIGAPVKCFETTQEFLQYFLALSWYIPLVKLAKTHWATAVYVNPYSILI